MRGGRSGCRVVVLGCAGGRGREKRSEGTYGLGCVWAGSVREEGDGSGSNASLMVSV